jgi:hypothetical protein
MFSVVPKFEQINFSFQSNLLSLPEQLDKYTRAAEYGHDFDLMYIPVLIERHIYYVMSSDTNDNADR